MNGKLHVVTATVLSGLLAAGGAIAQTAPSTRGNSNAPVCPPGCVAVSQCNQARNAPTQAQRLAALRRRRAKAHQRQQAEQARLEQERQQQEELARQQADQARLARERAEQDRLNAQRAYEDAAGRKRAEADQLAREEQQRLAMQQPTVITSRGGGPHAYRPHLILGLDGGMGGLTGDAHNTSYVGPMWGARIGVAFASWFGIEGRYMGMWNAGYANNVGSGVGLLTNGGFGDLRFTIPTRYVQPYVFGGVGGFHTSVTGSAQNRQASSLHTNNSADIPLGGGIDIPIGHRWGLGFEGTYHHLFNESFSSNPLLSDGDFWTAGTVVHVNL